MNSKLKRTVIGLTLGATALGSPAIANAQTPTGNETSSSEAQQNTVAPSTTVSTTQSETQPAASTATVPKAQNTTTTQGTTSTSTQASAPSQASSSATSSAQNTASSTQSTASTSTSTAAPASTGTQSSTATQASPTTSTKAQSSANTQTAPKTSTSTGTAEQSPATSNTGSTSSYQNNKSVANQNTSANSSVKANTDTKATDTSKATTTSATEKAADTLSKKYEAVQTAKTEATAKQEASDTANQKADDAKSDLTQAKQITTDAQEDYNNAKADVDTAQKNYDSAKKDTENAQKALDQAKAEQKAAEDRVSAANKASDDAENAVKTATAQKEAAEKALAEAKQAATNATTDQDAANAKVADARKAVDEATQAVTKAQKTADEKYNALLKAQSDLDALNTGSQVEKAAQALKAAQEKEAEAQTAYNTAKDTSDKANADLDTAKTNQSDAQKALEEAQAAAKQAEEDLATANSTYEKAKNVYDNAGQNFIESHTASDVSVNSIMNRAKTTGSVHDPTIMTNIADPKYTDNTYLYISKWDVLNNAHFQEALKSAFSVENIEKDIAYMEEVNADRAKEGKDPYKVDYSVLFDAIFNSAYQSVLGNEFGLYDHWAPGLYSGSYVKTYDKDGNRINLDDYLSVMTDTPKTPTEEESKTELYDCLGNDLNITMGEAIKDYTRIIQAAPGNTANNTYANARFGGENLAWGWYNDKGEADPVYGWYDYEKETKELNEKYKGDDAKLREIYNERGGCGHYGALISDTYQVMGIGFVDDNAINYSSEGTDNNYGIAFNPDRYHYAYTSAMEMCTIPKTATAEITTVDAVKEAFQSYMTSIKQKLSDAKDALTKAQDAKTKADQAVKDAQAKVDALASTVTAAQTKADAAAQALSDAQTKLDDAKANTDSAQSDYNKALEADKNLAAAIQAQQKVVDQAKAENDSAQQALSDAKAKQSKAKDALSAAQTKQKEADQKAKDAQADVSAKESALSNATAALKDAESVKTKADQEKTDAGANKTDKDSKEKDAESNKLTAEQKEQQLLILLNLSKANLADTVSAHIEALPDTDTLTLKDKDTVDTLGNIFDSMTSDTQSLISKEDAGKLDQARQKIADLVLIQKDKDTAKAVEDQVNNLPDTITADNAKDVYNAQKAYNKLTDRQKDYAGQDVKNKLEEAVKEADKATADEVNKAIDDLPKNVTLNDKAQIEKVRQMYNALSNEAKKQVDTTRLNKEEAAIRKLEKEKSDYEEAKKVETLINSLPKNVTAKNRQGVMNIYERYNRLSPSAKQKLSKATLAKLYNAMKQANVSGTGKNGHPKTGDNTTAGVTTAALIAGIAGLGILLERKKRFE